MNDVEKDWKAGERLATKRRLEDLDWDFATQQSESRFSHLHWHPCRFPSQVPAIAISRLSQKEDVILDPFMGSATTLVEAQRLGRPSIGIDINPISTMLGRSKLLILPLDQIHDYINRLISQTITFWDRIEYTSIPTGVQSSKWYADETLEQLNKIWSIIQMNRGQCSSIGDSAFSSILISVCKETRHWGYVCDNTNPKTSRVGDAKAAFLKALKLYKLAYQNRFDQSHDLVRKSDVCEGDSRKVLEKLANASIGCIITSPPYFGVADYVKSQRLSMEWFNLKIEPIRKAEIGARSKRHRKTAELDFLDDLKSVFSECHRVLKPGGYTTIVFGSSPKRNNTIPEFLENLKKIGFNLETNIERTISSMRRQTPSLSSESVIILRKKG
jgi:SAM-dependent methyltransferase